MGIAIGQHDEASGRMRYLRDDSTEDMQWSTVDPMRAKVWHSAGEARAWIHRLPGHCFDRLTAVPRCFVTVDREAQPEAPWLDECDIDLQAEHLECLESIRRESERRATKGTKK